MDGDEQVCSSVKEYTDNVEAIEEECIREVSEALRI